MKTGMRETLDEDFRIRLQDYGLQFDPTTGMANQASFRRSLREVLETAGQFGQELSLLWIDVLNLRREYSIGGDEAAERLIQKVADGLRPWIDPGELICRFSEQSFVLVLRRDERTMMRLNLILDAGSHNHGFSAEGKPELAGGVAFFPEHTTELDDLIRFASLAAVGGARTRSHAPVTFAPVMNSAILLERELETDLRNALRGNQLSLVYQPQIDLVTGNILGVEGLTRWNHPVRGAVSPAQFIAIAEQSNLIDEIFTHSLRRLLVDAARWRQLGVIMPVLAVNASAANVRNENFVSMVQREIEANPPIGSQLDIEVTESLMMDDETLFVERLTALRNIGVKVTLDDFGTRYTGFNALKGLPLNTMKIDKCFVHGIDRSTQAQSLCRTIVTMARHLNLATIAEGVETAGELRALRKIGCLGGQGYLFQRPVASQKFLEFVKSWPRQKLVFEMGTYGDGDEAAVEVEADPLFGVV
ncbi:putative bifunctional diguanylate cyclase/phosphodiesterase [Acidicapsa dinghuensis]|uniref:Bifunctional diguanylate cyclase/phosphodiesterase n=1 Tax=Acidicapsa dinghuensis TaxID=2218256 RepID=A0ABW1EB76_9BACT|nr:GGDEF domain-containing phosphodiesterase [Acidicapsa dinghuensis]